MASQKSKLNSLFVQRAKTKGLFADGGGLYLQVSAVGTKSWLFRFMLNGKARAMGLGSIDTVSLAEARMKAMNCRKLLLDGIDPIEDRNVRLRQQELDSAPKISFDKCAAAYIDSHRLSWKSLKHAEQWKSTLATYASPVFGHLPVAEVDTALVMRALDSIWTTKTETATRVRSRIELVLDWSTVLGHRKGDNPARWRGHLDKLLPKRSSVRPVQHHKALQIKEMHTFMQKLRAEKGIARLALEFLILTAARTGEVIGATWDEICFSEELWTVPSARMKAKKDHRVPLSKRALQILNELRRTFPGVKYVFPGLKANRHLSNVAMLALVERMGYQITIHGFRSTFRDWAGEFTNHPREVAEAALAHTIRDQVEAAYRRGDMILKRRVLMNDWEKFCDQKPIGEAIILEIKTGQV